jgi:uncharacterized protein
MQWGFFRLIFGGWLAILLVLLSLDSQAQTDTLRQKIDQGDADAAFKLYEIFRKGWRYIKPNEDSCFKYLKASAGLGNLDAQYLLGLAYLRGLYVQKDVPRAIAWLEMASEQGNEYAMVLLAEHYGGTNRFLPPDEKKRSEAELKTAFEYFVEAAKKGSKDGAYNLARAYLAGKGTARNDSLGLVWMTLAANKYNHVLGQIKLGYIYLEGNLTFGCNLDKALYYFSRAANNGSAGLEATTEGVIGVHETQLLKRQIINLHNLFAFPDPLYAPQFQVRPE